MSNDYHFYFLSILASAEAVAAAKAAQSEMYSALLARRQNLMAEFEKKAARYKDILVKEMVKGHQHKKHIVLLSCYYV